MTLEKRPGPSKPLPKENGKWTFHIYPNCVAQESGEYDTEEAAADASLHALVNWQANGYTYGGSVSTITSPITVVRDDIL
jgi:hypothetical protein